MFKFWWCLAVLQVWWLVHSCCLFVSAQPPCSWKALLFWGGLPSSSRKNSCGVSDHFLSFELSCSRLGNTTCWLAWGEIEYKVDMMLSSKTHLRERGKHRRAAALQPRYGLRSRYSGLSVPITMGTKYDKTFSGKWSHTSDTIIFRTSVTIEIITIIDSTQSLWSAKISPQNSHYTIHQQYQHINQSAFKHVNGTSSHGIHDPNNTIETSGWNLWPTDVCCLENRSWAQNLGGIGICKGWPLVELQLTKLRSV